MFSHYPSRCTSSPFDSYYYDPYRAAALQQQQRRRQLELEAARREQARLAQARRLQQLRAQQQAEEEARRQAYLEHLRNQQQYYCQPEEEDEEEEEQEQYYQHPFFPIGFAPQRQQQRRQPSPPVQRRQFPSQQQQQQYRRSASPKSIHIPIDGDVQASRESHSVPINVTSASTPAASPCLSVVDLERRENAASTIQSHWRTHTLRSRALSQISAIRDAFTSLQSTFTFPSTVDFVTPASPSAPDAVPALAYTPTNRPILAYEHSATELLTRLDAVDSAGDKGVRKARKALVNEIEAAMRGVENAKVEAWRRLCAPVKEVQAEQAIEQEHGTQEQSMEEDSMTAANTNTESEDVVVPDADAAQSLAPEPQSQSPAEPVTSTPLSTSTPSHAPIPIVDTTPTSPNTHSDSDIDADIVLVDQPSEPPTTVVSQLPSDLAAPSAEANEMQADADDDDWVDASDEAWIDALALPDQDEQDEKDVEMQLDTRTSIPSVADVAADGQ